MVKYNGWEIKQLLDLTAKSLNSLIINGKEADISAKSFEYLAIYKKLLDALKMPEPKVFNTGWDSKKQEIYNEDSEVIAEAQRMASDMGRKYVSGAMVELAKEKLNK